METLRVLVTDDEMGMRLGIERTLRNFTVRVPDVAEEVGFVVDQADSGEAALEKIAQTPPDILLLDHKMPGISGLDVLEQLQGRENEILTIMITAYASIETAVTATRRGAYDFLTKPFTPEELKGTVRKAAARLILAKQARRLAEEKRQVRFQFIRVLGHELKSPLGAVEGYLNMLRDPRFAPDEALRGEFIDRSLVRLEGMRKLIADLLDLTHFESGKRKRELAPVDVCAVARAAIETHQPEAAIRSVTVSLRSPDKTGTGSELSDACRPNSASGEVPVPVLSVPGPVEMTADRGELEIILNNLISNAIKYNRDGGRVDVAVTKQEQTVSIAVSDTGIGLTPAEAENLFGEFVRIRNEKTRDILGSGLGLSIVKRIAALYNGTATITSQPDVGSTFCVTLVDG